MCYGVAGGAAGAAGAPGAPALAVGRNGVRSRRGGVERRRVVRIEGSGRGRARRADLRVGELVRHQRPDESVDSDVVRAVQLELVAPGLQRDRLVQTRVRRHQQELAGLDVLLEGLDIVFAELVGVVGEPDRAVLE